VIAVAVGAVGCTLTFTTMRHHISRLAIVMILVLEGCAEESSPMENATMTKQNEDIEAIRQLATLN
jgi:hypothetical protein